MWHRSISIFRKVPFWLLTMAMCWAVLADPLIAALRLKPRLAASTPLRHWSDLAHNVVQIYIGYHRACLGIIFSDTEVITAAHCVHRWDRSIGRSWRDVMSAAVPRKTSRIFVEYTSVEMRRPIVSFRANKAHDVALIKLGARHPEDYKTPAIDVRSRMQMMNGRIETHAHITFVGAENHRLVKIDARKALIQKHQRVAGINVKMKDGGSCAGNSGGPAYLTTAKGRKLFGMVQGGYRRSKRFVVPNTNQKCSRLAYVETMGNILKALRQ